MQYKRSLTLDAGETGQIVPNAPLAREHVLQVDGDGSATIRVSINAGSGMHDFGQLSKTLVTSRLVGVEVWDITASGAQVTVTVCGD